ncbi:MAG: TMEM165/GDT1 family protein [Gammaproteobacteria bacterium]|nr:TMEM165/GDT1 family protein [Gammaproteobacteria bacterium]
MNWAAFLSSFTTMLLVELPDKTLIATLILSTHYRKIPVFIGVCFAFLVQCVLAVLAGSLLHKLPEHIVAYIVSALFAIGAIVLWREANNTEEDDDIESVETTSSFKMALVSFTVLFAAEWGDASQLLTVALTAKYHAPFAVGLGSWLALVSVAALAILLGKFIQSKVPFHVIQRIAAFVFAAFAGIALYTAVGM